jgi:endonuclease-3
MARKSPRSRGSAAPSKRLPKAPRPRATPGKRTSSRAKASARTTASHVRSGARASAPARAAGRKPKPRRLVARPKRSRFRPPEPGRVAAILAILEAEFPDATTALDFGTPLQLLVATILSAQCTDARVNMVTPGLFARYPDARALADAPQAELEAMIRSTGFFRNKAKAIRACSADIVAKHGGEVPNTLESLTALRGVGRKTANVVLGNAFGVPGLVVDTHVARLAKRLGLTRESDPVKIEFALMPVIPRERWSAFSHWLILHGRRTCIARKPKCSTCPLAPHCPRIGVTASA